MYFLTHDLWNVLPRLQISLGSESVHLMTFGQPRIGNAAFASYFEQYVPSAIRVTHEHDIVPHLPPYFFFLPHLTYHHFPREVCPCINLESVWLDHCQNSLSIICLLFFSTKCALVIFYLDIVNRAQNRRDTWCSQSDINICMMCNTVEHQSPYKTLVTMHYYFEMQ